jgi:hypothetical protein
MEYVAKHFTKREVNTLLDDVIKHMTPGRVFEDHYPELVSIINRIIAHMTDFHILFSMVSTPSHPSPHTHTHTHTQDKFLPFMDLLQKDSVKVEVCQNVVKSFIIHQTEDTSDPVVINANMYLCKAMHDHLNALSLHDERRQVGSLVVGFLMKISFGRDFEQQLGFFVEARASFSNVDSILVYLIQSVNRLAMETRCVVKGVHSRKTAAFVRACAAYCFITIPSVDNILLRLNLYLLSGRVAVANGALSQGEPC